MPNSLSIIQHTTVIRLEQDLEQLILTGEWLNEEENDCEKQGNGYNKSGNELVNENKCEGGEVVMCGNTAPRRYDNREGNALCRRWGLL